MSFRIVFAGTPEFARAALAQLLAAGFEVPLVLTQPANPTGKPSGILPRKVRTGVG